MELDNDKLTDRQEEAQRLLLEYYREIRWYIATLVPSRPDTDDIMQEVCLVIWRRFDSFMPGTNFRAWAYKIAENCVRAWQKRRRTCRLVFSDAVLQAVSDETEALSESGKRTEEAFQQTRELLQTCLSALPAKNREIVHLRYSENKEIDYIANLTGRSTGAVYRLLSRIRTVLFECMKSSRPLS